MRLSKITLITGLTLSTCLAVAPPIVNDCAAVMIESGTLETAKFYNLTADTLQIGSGNMPDKNIDQQERLLKNNPAKIKVIRFIGDVKANSKVTNIFANLPNLERIEGLSNLDISSLTSLERMFANTPKLNSLDIGSFHTENISSLKETFFHSGIKTLNLSTWNVDKPTDLSDAFAHSNLQSLDLSNWHPQNLIQADGAFEDTKLSKVNLSNLAMSSSSDMLKGTELQQLQLSKTNSLKNAGLTPGKWRNDSDQKVYSSTQLEQMYSKPETAVNTSFSRITDASQETPKPTEPSGDRVNHPIAEQKPTDINPPTAIVVPETVPDETSTSSDNHTLNIVKPVEKTPEQKPSTNKGVDHPSIQVEIQKPHLPEPTPHKKTPVGQKPDVTQTKPTNKPIFPPAEITSHSVAIESPTKNQSINKPESSTTAISSDSTISKHPKITTDQPKPKSPLIIQQWRTVTTLFKNKPITVYNTSLEKVVQRKLSVGSDWFSEQKMLKNGKAYFRISTNEWVLADDVYEYQPQTQIITTKSDSNKSLMTDQGELVNNRQLSKNSHWFTDRSTTIKGKLYYRVSTNSFISAQDIE
ncbi:BspA family leucine-rich repeat surface protein [Companilactobacillus versmoldensis]|uniref:S-layer protein C-terminal domain-containing protein n=1 Tax=Companilactobacillus versmoldensis DSM 14857 = KCTC 3814 TaxID=1423815 RepID=A0A0R1SEF8_9LACO|nr:BspA family leucine-rich repeat surface protein [Companilactobacillus versmoldensis]KRL67520.1 hypothetical protein FC27_GL001836 [Companilactobacillus versmoldensis DSM 14857 = KCTC 3814]